MMRSGVSPTLTTRLKSLGISAWSALGVIALVVVIALAVGAVSGILVPLVIAVILGVVLEPLVDRLEKWRVPPVPAAVVTLLLAVAVLAGTIAIVVVGFIDQWSEIARQLTAGWNSLVSWVQSLDINDEWLEPIRSAIEDAAQNVGQGVFGAVSSTFYGAISLVMGTFFSFFFLFFVLRDGHRFAAWLARNTRLEADSVAEVVEISRESIRGYFRGTAITALLTAPIFLIPLFILRIPLVIPILILYFLLSFVPFVGAWITGAFVVLIAFGTGGASAAAIMAVTFLISNGTIQSAVSSWALGSSLRLHPIWVLLATMIGGTIAGLIGMVLGAPMLAVVLKSIEAMRRRRTEDGQSAAESDQGPALANKSC
ncbi:AI-2E family transporter [Gordonia sp. ABSL49_1]|uniref:AI-2E family transporter n=1 Tax=unclassified Gordonia (in: high G+C Gram-positive bacteria) TaxID=2657482 RepID=UPI001F0DF4D4|nr:AI-2E family transporter [Gordonia sp. ABSL49_1]MCH5644854.1 AI-2E family transporter [Gordonia sp. ABSL49_1]